MTSKTNRIWMKKIWISIIFISSIFTQSLAADEQTQLKKYFLNLIDEVTLIVEDKTLDKSARNLNIVNTITPTFDFELMAKLSLGKTWKKISKPDRKKFIKLYVKRMEQSYSSKLDSYSGEKVEIKKLLKPKKNRIVLITDLVNKEKKLEIAYKFYKPKKEKAGKNTWLIYDVEISGISILKADKAQFKEFLRTKTIHKLMDILIKKSK